MDSCRMGVRGYSNMIVTIGYGNPTQSPTDPKHLIIRNCTETGVLLYNMSTGHLDFSELDANRVGATVKTLPDSMDGKTLSKIQRGITITIFTKMMVKILNQVYFVMS